MSAPTDRPAFSVNGFAMLVVIPAVLAVAIWLFVSSVDPKQGGVGSLPALLAAALLLIVDAIALGGFTMIQPNQARVLIFFGSYAGTVRESGFHWVNPFTQKRLVSLRAQNFQSDKLKVNEARGNPIEIAAVVVWRVKEPTRAVFAVESYGAFVGIQSETAVRALASHFPYDAHAEQEQSLRGSPDAVNEKLRAEVQGRLDIAGLEVMEARLSHLAYAPEIAQAMLRRQQAEAVIAARTKLVDGAVGMVELALRRLAEGKIVTLDEERKAAMVNNLMVALVSEEPTQPVVNAGTMYP